MNILKKFKLEHWIIIFIVFLSLFLRLYKISSYMTFLGDEGRDALVWLRMLRGKFTLIGPQTSIGNMYLGPLYYYLMLPFYILLGTIGPSVGVALFAGATTYLLWFFGKEWFSKRAGLISAFLYAISPVAITLSRSSWNPNVMPFFSLLIIWGVWQFWQKNNYLWLALEGVLLSFAVQSHYLGILLMPVVGLFFVVKLIYLIKSKSKGTNKLLVNFALCTLNFALLTALPLIWFDLRHNFINYKAFYRFFSERQTTVNFRPYKAIPQLWPLWRNLVGRLIGEKNGTFGFWFSGIFGVVFLVLSLLSLSLPRRIFTPILRSMRVSIRIDNVSKRLDKDAILLLFAWLFSGLLGMGLYKQHIYDHYFGFLFPAIFLLAGIVLERFWNLKIFGKIVASVLFCLIIVSSFRENPFRYPPNMQMQKTEEISQKIVDESDEKLFNLGLIAKQNYDAGYRYFLEKCGRKAVEIDPQKAEETITSQLFVVCEVDQCQPTTHPQAEIANFGWSKIEKEWEFPWGVKLFKLVHYYK